MKENFEEEWIVAEANSKYEDGNFPLKGETFEIIGICMEVHRILGPGFREAVYKDALEDEFTSRGIPYEREKKYEIKYKGKVLPHAYYADFVVRNEIILEAKSLNKMSDVFYGQVVNYLAASKLRVGLLVNFGERSLNFRRLIFGNDNR